MKEIFLASLSALIFLLVLFTLDADARHKRKAAKLGNQHMQSSHLVRFNPAKSAYAQAALAPSVSLLSSTPIAYGSGWDKYGLRWD